MAICSYLISHAFQALLCLHNAPFPLPCQLVPPQTKFPWIVIAGTEGAGGQSPPKINTVLQCSLRPFLSIDPESGSIVSWSSSCRSHFWVPTEVNAINSWSMSTHIYCPLWHEASTISIQLLKLWALSWFSMLGQGQPILTGASRQVQ